MIRLIQCVILSHHITLIVKRAQKHDQKTEFWLFSVIFRLLRLSWAKLGSAIFFRVQIIVLIEGFYYTPL